jgi:hypothetical protein
MEAGGGAVAAPPKKGQLKDRPAAGRRGRKSVRTFGHDFHFFSFFLFISPIKRFFFPKKGARAADPADPGKIVRQQMGPAIPGGLPPGLGGSTHAEAAGKRDKYSRDTK